MPFANVLPTLGDIVHGGAISADARVIRRTTRGICFIEVSVATEDGSDVALALVTYQL